MYKLAELHAAAPSARAYTQSYFDRLTGLLNQLDKNAIAARPSTHRAVQPARKHPLQHGQWRQRRLRLAPRQRDLLAKLLPRRQTKSYATCCPSPTTSPPSPPRATTPVSITSSPTSSGSTCAGRGCGPRHVRQRQRRKSHPGRRLRQRQRRHHHRLRRIRRRTPRPKCKISVVIPTTKDEYGPSRTSSSILGHVVITYIAMSSGKYLHHG